MRFACLLAAALLATGCGVPDVSFADAGGSRDAALDSPPQADAPGEARAGDAETDAESDASADAADSGEAGDAATDAPEYCKDDAGPPTGPMYKCCGGATGTVCSGNCNAQACLSCGVCAWPAVCCPMGAMGTCKDGGC